MSAGEWLTVKQAADRFLLRPGTLWQWVARDVLKPEDVRRHGRRMVVRAIAVAELERDLRTRGPKARRRSA